MNNKEQLSRRVNGLEESQTIGMSKLARELADCGKNVINLSLGEPDFPTPDDIREAAKKAIDQGFTHYPPISGFKDLRIAIAQKFKKQNNLDFTFDQVVVSTGAKQSIANVVLCLVNPGDEVVTPVPYWVSYLEIIKLAEGKFVPLPATIDSDFKITPAQLEKAITAKTKLFIFCSPCNPTGTVYTHEELKALAAVFAKNKHVYILSDEIYEHINFMGNNTSLAEFPEIRDRVIIVNGVSKAYAMTGWRIGYIAAPKWIAQACDKLQGQFTSGTSTISQKAAEAALTGSMESVNGMVKAFKQRRDLVVKLIKEIPGFKTNNPQGAFYLFPDISYYFGKTDGDKIIRNADDFAMFLLYKACVSTVSGIAFGDPNCIRFSYAASEEQLKEAMRRINETVKTLVAPEALTKA